MDMDMFNEVLFGEDLQADQWKIYPCEVVPWTVRACVRALARARIVRARMVCTHDGWVGCTSHCYYYYY